MSYRVCAEHLCPELVPDGRWCAAHKPKRPKDRRPSAGARGYDARWRRFRAGFLKRHPTCVVCGGVATVVDHLDGLGPLGPRGYDETNCAPMCKRHHDQKTAAVDGAFGRPKVPR